MKNYINYINETKLNLNWLDVKELNSNEFESFLYSKDFSEGQKHRSDSNINDKSIYRSVDLKGDYYILKPTGEIRQSAWLNSNYYTLLLNNLPSWSKYPKRTHVCSNKYFQFNQNVFKVIPINGAKIGICPSDDIQAPFKAKPSTIKLHRLNIEDLVDLNRYYEDINKNKDKPSEKWFDSDLYRDYSKEPLISDTDWNKFKEDIKREKENILSQKDDDKPEPRIMGLRKIPKIQAESLLDIDKLNEILNPEELGVTYDEYINTDLGLPEVRVHHNGLGDMREIWLDSIILLQKI